MGKTENLKKAILQTTGDGQYLLPYDLEPVLEEELLRLQPLMQLLPFAQANSKTHEYTLRTSHPQGWFEGEPTPANPAIGGYSRKTVQCKIGRIWGSVSGFAQAMDERFVDALATEIDNSLNGMADLFEYAALFGCSDEIGFTGDVYQTSGILPRLYKYAPTNVIDAGGDKVTLTDLDDVIAIAKQYRQTRMDDALWFMGIKMKQVVDGLQSKVQLPLQSVELADGKIVMAAYGGDPILETNYLVPGTTSPTCGGSIGAGGSLPLGDYDYILASVTMFGECIGGTASGTITSAATNNTANLTWTADSNAKLYMLFRQFGGSGDYSLIDIFPAKTYDSNGTVTGTKTTYSDDGSLSPITQVNPLLTGEQMIVFANRTRRGAQYIGKVDDMGRQVQNMLSFVELARVKDTYDYMLKSYFALMLKYPNLMGAIRHVKTA